MIQKYDLTVGERLLSIETGRLAGQANGAVTVRYGDTVVLATATATKEPRPDIDFFPLTVDYEERMYAAGKIPGGFFKREGRPSEQAILTMRMTDRPIRPLFPKGFRNDVQVILTVLSVDAENPPDALCAIAASAALTISDIPFEGPIASVKVGYIDGQWVLNPTSTVLPSSTVDMIVAGSKDAIVMVEGGCKEVPEQLLVEGLRFAHQSLQPIIDLQQRMRDELGKEKFVYPAFQIDPELLKEVRDFVGDRMEEVVYQSDKTIREDLRDELVAEAITQFGERFTDKQILGAIESLEKDVVRSNILASGRRADGRTPVEIRPISCEVGLLPRTHGSGLFTRGQTQVLDIATLGSVGDAQTIDGLGVEVSKRFMHHYNFPPYSTGEVKRVGSPGRREIGHGALAERALGAVVPAVEEFPYTIRLVSEVVASNGSSSMASVCAGCLSMMDAGVPIKAPVAGIAMGLITGEGATPVILSDIQGLEDHCGDMDFKVAGTAEGVTAIQMDIKVKGLSDDLLASALSQAREGRIFILGKMAEAITSARTELSEYAPRVIKTKIPVEKIGALIGPGGKNIRGIQEQTGCKIDVEDDGTVYVSSADSKAAQTALTMVEKLTRDVELGGVYMGKVSRLTNFGAFVEILPNKDGLVRNSELAEYAVTRPEDVVSIGDEIMVKVIEIDPQGRINLSRRAVLEGTSGTPTPPSGGAGGPGEGGMPPRRPPFGGGPRPSGPRPSGPRPGPGGERRGPGGPSRFGGGPSGERRGPSGPSRFGGGR
jgi:polyribonucleotide nucleotidyltransferase